MKKLLFTIFLAVSGLNLFGQGLTLYNMDYVPQSMRNNPAQIQRANFHLAIMPIFPNLNMSFVSNGFTASDLFSVDNGQTIVTPDALLSGLKETNFISSQINLDYLSFGFKVKKKNYFSFNVTERINFAFDYSKDFMTLLAKGTAADEFLGQTSNIAGTGFRFNHFREYAIGYSRQVNDDLSIGGRFKFLQGMSHFDNEQTDITLYTDPDNFSLTATSSIGIRMSGLSFTVDESQELDTLGYFKNFDNLGFALDIGGKYKINDRITTTLNISDLGFISWKNDAKRYYNNKAQFTFDGLDLGEYLEQEEDYTQNLADSLKEIFGLEKMDQEFMTTLIANIYVGGEYKLNNTFTAGALFNGKVFKGSIYPSLTISTQTNFGKWFQAIASYSIVNRSYSNIGLGAALNMGPLQIYAVSDNLLGLTQVDYAKNLNAQFGMNLLFGYKPKTTKEERKAAKLKRKLSKMDTDNDGTNDYEDKCPEVEGYVNGCPDRDGDQVADNVDMCPDVIGDSELFGCPDQDNDGIADYQDSCPTIYGLLGGCPDIDSDSVPDSEDLCPNTPGKLNGCPDSDGDGVSDGKDLCPDSPGDIANNGCPDSDGDGIYDNDDRCPDVKGDIKHLGCTDKDSDRDQVPDVFDDCPYRSGPESNKGCPK